MQTAPLTFYTNPESRARIVRRMLEELAVPYETVALDYDGKMKSADYLSINPLGKVPAITHGQLVVTETAAICTYLADAFIGKGLAPALNSVQRGNYYRWLFFTAGPLEMVTTANACNWNLAENPRLVGSGSYVDVVNALEQALANGPYICGEQFTAADVYVGSHISWGLQFNGLPSRPAFQAYAERLAQRPAFQRADQLDNELSASMNAESNKSGV